MFTRFFPSWSDEYTQPPFSCLLKIHFFFLHVYLIFFFFFFLSLVFSITTLQVKKSTWEIKTINLSSRFWVCAIFLNIYTRYSQVCFTQIYRNLHASEGQYNYSSLEEIMEAKECLRYFQDGRIFNQLKNLTGQYVHTEPRSVRNELSRQIEF